MWNNLVSLLLSQDGDFVLKTCQCLMTYSHMEIGSEHGFLISAAKSAVFYALLLLHLLPTLSAMWKVHPLPGSNGKNERKEGSASSGPSDRCGHPMTGGRGVAFPPCPFIEMNSPVLSWRGKASLAVSLLGLFIHPQRSRLGCGREYEVHQLNSDEAGWTLPPN